MIQKKISLIKGRWTKEENLRFSMAMASNEKSWAAIALIVGTRTQDQCRSHYQKLKIRQRINEIKLKKSGKCEKNEQVRQVTDTQTQYFPPTSLTLMINPKEIIENSPVFTPKTMESSDFDAEICVPDDKKSYFFESEDEEPDFLKF